MDARQRTELVARISAYTGLSETYVEQSNLRILVNRFYKELLRDKGLVVGRLDGRYTGSEVERVNEFAESDPTFNAIGSAYNTAINVHLSETLDVKMNRPYKILGGSRVSQNWNWRLDKKTPNGGRFINVVPNLGRAMRHNKDLKVLVASGYYDFATPFFGAENALSQDGVVADRITYTYYKTGHMIFLDEANRKKLLADVRSLITGRGQ